MSTISGGGSGIPMPTLHGDGTVTYWSVHKQQWACEARNIPDEELAAMNPAERERVREHLERYRQRREPAPVSTDASRLRWLADSYARIDWEFAYGAWICTVTDAGGDLPYPTFSVSTEAVLGETREGALLAAIDQAMNR